MPLYCCTPAHYTHSFLYIVDQSVVGVAGWWPCQLSMSLRASENSSHLPPLAIRRQTGTTQTVRRYTGAAVERSHFFFFFCLSPPNEKKIYNKTPPPLTGRTPLDVGKQAQKIRFKFKALLSFSVSRIKTACFQARVSLHRPTLMFVFPGVVLRCVAPER